MKSLLMKNVFHARSGMFLTWLLCMLSLTGRIVADEVSFYGSPRDGCAPLTVIYVDESDYPAEYTRQWHLPGATPSDPVGTTVTVVYNHAGVYDATLEINAYQKYVDALTRSNYIEVYECALLDFGDAPDDASVGLNYRTLLSNDGARHDTSALYLGSMVDVDTDGQPDADAQGDDNADWDDEDGVTIGNLISGTGNSITVTAHNSGFLNVWIDWGADGSWDEAGDHMVMDMMLSSGANTVSFIAPSLDMSMTTYARFRISSSQGLGWYGYAADGEVEDYRVVIEVLDTLDYGDAPEPYPTLLAANGARHMISSVYYLGEAVPTDTEPDGQPHATAGGDDSNGADDENGLTFETMMIGQSYSIPVIAHGSGRLHLWIDFNGNGSWEDPGDLVAGGETMGAILNHVPVTIPGDAAAGATFARARYSADRLLSPSGLGSEGEVEDYQVILISPLDFGDAPAPFPTLAADGGAAHRVSRDIYLGDVIPDGELDGNPHSAAEGDDMEGADDEDGWGDNTIPIGELYTFTVATHGRGFLNVWIDLDRNGDWAGADEHVIAGVPLGSDTYTFGITLPATSTPGHSYLRIRYSTDAEIGPTDLGGYGEVEDYVINLIAAETYDHGDAPESYGDASHALREDVYIGDVPPDAELAAHYSDGATGDNDVDINDEEGIVFTAAFIQGGTTAISYRTHGGGGLFAWFDWNADGDFNDPGEQAFSVGIAPGSGLTTGGFTVTVPPGAMPGLTYARFRFGSPEGPVHWGPAVSVSPTSVGEPGEVEDYQITILSRYNVWEFDYGDAHDTYDMTGRHTVSDQIYLGDHVDAEPAMQFSTWATGDDVNGPVDDEDGFTVRPMWPGAINNLLIFTPYVSEGVTGYIHAWLDINQDGDWNDADEKLIDAHPINMSGSHGFNIPIPQMTSLGLTFFRVRFSTQRDLEIGGYGGPGEVEDYVIPMVLDFGDAPIPYAVAAHAFAQSLWLGDQIDGEFIPQLDANAQGDDADVLDDEDGITIPILSPGNPAVITASVSFEGMLPMPGPVGYLNGWIDYNADHDWDDLGEHVIAGLPVDAGNNNFAINVPGGASAGETFARFRISKERELSYGGYTNSGEVEDYKVLIESRELDFGDAPDGIEGLHYPTLFSHGGAYHNIVSGIHLGTGIDGESDGQPHLVALGDDNAGTDDEDGVLFNSAIEPGMPVHLTVTASVEGYLNAWADFNGDGDWTDPNEQIFYNFALNAGANAAGFIAPPWMTADEIYLRFRFTTHAKLNPEDFFLRGAPDGEVEDYLVAPSSSGVGYLKWRQPPLRSEKSHYAHSFWGWDSRSVYGDTLLLDNWFCAKQTPITAIRWWGSYADWDSIVPPSDAPAAFHIGIWTDACTDTLYGIGSPHQLIWETQLIRNHTGEKVAGSDFHTRHTASPDTCFEYQVNLPEDKQFIQPTDSAYYWLSISAVYTGEPPEEHIWGWTTRETYLKLSAVQMFAPSKPKIDSLFRVGKLIPGWDAAFVLYTDEPVLDLDFGDADSMLYATTFEQNGAHHFIVSDLHMGDHVDSEPNSPGSVLFDWDDNEGMDDEDGVVSDTDTLQAGGFTFFTVHTSDQSMLNLWIDFNRNGSWGDPGEHAIIDMPCSSGNNNLAVNIPRTAKNGETGVRIRLSPVAGVAPTGIVIGGEVEDYAVVIAGGTATGIRETSRSVLPDEFRMMQNYPNPFNPMTTIPFHLAQNAELKITIYNILGRSVRTLVHGQWTAGEYNLIWNGLNDQGYQMPTGIYIYRIECRDIQNGEMLYQKSRKMLMLK